jgi:hypothetical protein
MVRLASVLPLELKILRNRWKSLGVSPFFQESANKPQENSNSLISLEKHGSVAFLVIQFAFDQIYTITLT